MICSKSDPELRPVAAEPHGDAAVAQCCGSRRALLRGALGVALGTGALSALAAPPPERRAPQPDDGLCFPSDTEGGRLVVSADVPAAGPPLLVYPRDPDSGVIREKSRLNQILLLRLDPARVDDRTRALMAEDVIAYSGVCTHAACAVSEWDGEKKLLLCPCHGSQFDASARAKVMGGPAPRPLPVLPIRRAGEGYAVAGKFTGKVGLKPT